MDERGVFISTNLYLHQDHPHVIQEICLREEDYLICLFARSQIFNFSLHFFCHIIDPV